MRTESRAHGHPGAITRAAHALALSALGLALAACSSGAGVSDRSTGNGRQTVPSWDAKATPASVSRQLHVHVPREATEVKAAYQHGLQDDGLLLAFVLPTSEADEFVEQLVPGHGLTRRDKPLHQSATPMTPFSHLGLPEPETLTDVREGQVCNPCQGELNSLTVAAHPIDAHRSRVYLRGID